MKHSDFLTKSYNLHKTKYKYLTEYISSNKKMSIQCNTCSYIFDMTPNKHLSGQGCSKCARTRHKEKSKKIKNDNINKLIREWKELYNNYTYKQKNNTIVVTCEEHGETINVYRGANSVKYPCRKCGIKIRSDYNSYTNEHYIKHAKILHENKFSYFIKDNVIYANCDNNAHPPFELTGNIKYNHLNKLSGCKECKKVLFRKKYSKTQQEFINESKIIHNNMYDYTLVNYINCHTKVKIICKKHGVFEQTPLNHLQRCGCKICNQSLAENTMAILFDKYNISYEREYTFDDCLSPKNRKLKYDFFISKLNMLIELDGQHHFKVISYSDDMDKNEENYKNVVLYDEIKNKYAIENNIKLIRVPYTDFKYIPEIVNDIKVLIDNK